MCLRNLIKSAKIEIINFLLISRKNSSRKFESCKTIRHYYFVTLLYPWLRTWGNAFRAKERVVDVLRSKAASLTTPPRVVFELRTLTLRESSMMVGAKRCSAYWIAYRFTLIRNILFEKHWDLRIFFFFLYRIKICKNIIDLLIKPKTTCIISCLNVSFN